MDLCEQLLVALKRPLEWELSRGYVIRHVPSGFELFIDRGKLTLQLPIRLGFRWWTHRQLSKAVSNLLAAHLAASLVSEDQRKALERAQSLDFAIDSGMERINASAITSEGGINLEGTNHAQPCEPVCGIRQGSAAPSRHGAS